MIEIKNLNKYYQSGGERVHALKDINIKFPNKGLIFILGPSGCGKSTLLNQLGGLDKADDGDIYIEDRALSSFSKKDLNNYLNSYLGFVFQEYNILKDLNLYENISLPLELQNVPKKEIKQRVEETIEKVELSGLANRKINELSGGQRQRIAVARALIKNPKVIIADEPTGNLDSATGETIFNLFKNLAQERLIIIVTHDEESAYKYGDRIIRLADGKVASDTINDQNVELVYNQEKLELKKAHIPLKISIKLSLKNMWKKKFRFILMSLICALSLTFLAFTIELNGDKIRQNVYTSVGADYLYTDVLKKYELPDNFVETSVYDKYSGVPLNDNSYSQVKKDLDGLNIHQYQIANINIVGSAISRADYFFTGIINYIVRFDETNNYTLLAGRTPVVNTSEDFDMIYDVKEIMITDYVADMLTYFGIFPNADSIEDYLNKFINIKGFYNFKIVGIIKTNYNNWHHLKNNYEAIDLNIKQNYAFANDLKAMNAFYLPYEYFKAVKAVPIAELDLDYYYMDVYATHGNVTSDIKTYKLSLEKQEIYSGAITTTTPGGGQNTKNYKLGSSTNNGDQIVIPLSLARKLFPDVTLDIANIKSLSDHFNSYIRGAEITLTVSNSSNELINQTFTICGINNTEDTVELHETVMNEWFNVFNNDTEYMVAEMPKVEKDAYKEFKKAYRAGYILDMFAYQADIDSYTIDPFIDLLSKVGLFVFAVFTIGILWTIISIEIVDSKKEIGIFRSIGLSGSKVSFIFIFQTAIISIVAWGLSLIASNFILNIFNQNIMDDLGIIRLSMYMMTYRSPIFLIIFLIIMTGAAIFIPLYKIMSQKIIDVISERDAL